jgi:hypothetical protein
VSSGTNTDSKSDGASLRARLARVEAEAEALKRLVVLAEHKPELTKPVTDRIYDMLRANHEWAFSPAEIMEAVHAGEEAVRKALQRLMARGLIEWKGHAAYRVGSWEANRLAGHD